MCVCVGMCVHIKNEERRAGSPGGFSQRGLSRADEAPRPARGAHIHVSEAEVQLG